MTVHPAVAPVVDYEPAPRAIGHVRSPLPARRGGHPPRRRPGARRPAAPQPALWSAGAFAESALRRVLEVIDRRRPLIQLRGVLAVGLVDSVLSMRPAAAGSAHAAALRRVRVQAVERRGPPTAVEAFGTYSRGRRIHAVACRVEQVPDDNGGRRWQVVALHIG